MFLARTVLGYFPEAHNLKDPKSLYQSLSGAIGPDPTHSCNRRRSANLSLLHSSQKVLPNCTREIRKLDRRQ